jgi:predicted naringenin-chalcone synthase
MAKAYPKIISIGFTVPSHRYTQEEVFRRLGYPRGYRRLFNDNGINSRYFWLDLDAIPRLSFQEQQEEYQRGAIAMSQEAIRQCLDGRSLEGVGCLTYCSCTGIAPGPTIPHYLAKNLLFSPGTYICNIGGMGCEAGYPGLKRALDFTVATGKPSLVVTCELSSCSCYPEPNGIPDPTNDFEIMRSNAIFADAASCALVGYDNDWRHPEIVDSESYTDTAYIDQLGFVWQNGRLRVRLSRKVPELAVKVLAPAVETLLKRNNLQVADIAWFIIHAAGSSVIDNIRDALEIPEEKISLSRKTLSDFGNTSSTSIGITGKKLMSQDIRQGDYALVLSIGPGMTGGTVLLKFDSSSS